MKNKIFLKLVAITFCLMPFFNANANSGVEYDTVDPVFLESKGDLLSGSGVFFDEDILRFSQKFSYGMTDKLSLSADIKYQQDFNGNEDGFSNVGLGAIYRLAADSNDNSTVVTDLLFGASFGGSRSVREPDFADRVYYAGLRMGRQWSAITLAGTVKTSWVFDDIRGMAYIDFIPEAYIRLDQDWMVGAGFDFKKATNPRFDQEWANFKLVRKYGRTQYLFNVYHEMGTNEYQFGVDLNILF